MQLVPKSCQVQLTTPVLSSWVSSYSWNEVADLQRKDPDLNIIINWLANKEEPSEEELFLSNAAIKNYWINRDLFSISENGVLWRRDMETTMKKLLVVPRSCTNEILSLSHDLPASGHQGQDRTLQRCKQRFYWYNMTHDVKRFVASCSVCNRNKKPNRKAKWQLTPYHAGVPMERVHLDFLGPLPTTKDDNSYILVMVDQFTKWVECIPLPSQSAEDTARAAINQFFSRFGFPFQIFTDRGTNFESNLFKQLCERLRIHKARTTAFRPSANGQVERFNRTLMDAVRCFASRTPSEWDEYLPQLASALRSSVNRATGYTPNMLMLGREVNSPIDLIFPGPQSDDAEDDDNYDRYVSNLVTQIQQTHELARDQLKTTQAAAKRDYDIKTFTHLYSVGDSVYILDTATPKGKCAK